MNKVIFIQKNDYRDIWEYISENNIKKILCVCGNSFSKLSLSNYIKNLPLDITYFSNFTPNPTYQSVEEGLRIYESSDYQAILSVGGGSAIDVGKAIKEFYYEKNKKNDLLNFKKRNLLLIAMPTTAGSGSESTNFAAIYRDGTKYSIKNDFLMPDISFLDPSTLTTLPIYQKKSTLLDALCQGIESMWSINSTKESKKYAYKSIKKIMDNYERYFKEDKNSYGDIMYASNLAGRAINISKTTAAHAMSYKISTLYSVAHGHSVALVMRKLFPFMIESIYKDAENNKYKLIHEDFINIANAMNVQTPYEASDKFKEIFDNLKMNIPKPKKEDYKILSDSVNQERLQNNPVKLTSENIISLYKDIFKNN